MAKIINGSTIYLALADHLTTNAYLNDTAQDVLVMVAKWIDEAPEITVPKWIPVTERLPEKGDLVLCIGARGGMFIASGMTRFSDGSCWCSVPNARRGRNATHWMPLPEAPKE